MTVIVKLPQKQVAISEQEMRIVFSGPAIAANKIYATVNPTAGVRLTFCEGGGPAAPPAFRLAVQLSLPDAIGLRDLLVRQLPDGDES